VSKTPLENIQAGNLVHKSPTAYQGDFYELSRKKHVGLDIIFF
jgi:hypothetical protein